MSMIGNYIRITPAQLEELQAKPDSVVGFIYDADHEWEMDVDKAWQGIHFLLTGDPWEGEPPLRNAVLGGAELGTEDAGYGPARYLTAQEVKDVAEALLGISEADLSSRFDAKQFEKEDIYPSIWDEGQEALDYLMDYYRDLVPFFKDAAAAGDAMLMFVN